MVQELGHEAQTGWDGGGGGGDYRTLTARKVELQVCPEIQ